MIRAKRWSVLAGVLWCVLASGGAARGEELEEERMPSAPEELKVAPKVEATPAVVPAFPAAAPQTCPAGPVGPVAHPPGGHPPLGSCLNSLGHWLFYKQAPFCKECKGRFTPYRPPLYVYMNCRPGGQCGNPNGVWQPPPVAVAPVPHPEVLPKPVMPALVGAAPEKSAAFSPSSAALGVPMNPMPTVLTKPKTNAAGGN
jgi:hypothetical protein